MSLLSRQMFKDIHLNDIHTFFVHLERKLRLEKVLPRPQIFELMRPLKVRRPKAKHYSGATMRPARGISTCLNRLNMMRRQFRHASHGIRPCRGLLMRFQMYCILRVRVNGNGMTQPTVVKVTIPRVRRVVLVGIANMHSSPPL